MLNEKQFDALLAELVMIRRSLTSIAASLAEGGSYLHEDFQDIVASIDGLAISAGISGELSSIEDDED